jgi:DNA adenine methylase
MLKWIGNKQRSAAAIAAYLPSTYGRYIEPFVGSAAVLATMSPTTARAGDTLAPLIDLWTQIRDEPETVLAHYTREWLRYVSDREGIYDEVLRRYNEDPNGLDLLFLCRTCYGGVVRFTKKGEMSTPLGAHRAIPPKALALRLALWRPRIAGTEFVHQSYEQTMADVGQGDVVYCDPPYSFSQAILYGAQDFSIETLWTAISVAKARGAKVAVSIDGSSRSGEVVRQHAWPDGLFPREVFLHLGGSMLKRFQLGGTDTEGHLVSDRLLLTW